MGRDTESPAEKAEADNLPVTTERSTGSCEDAEYPSGLKLVLVVFSLNLAMFLIGLDNTIISTAIPKITDRFHALTDVGWYISSYLLTNCAFQLMWGKFFTFYAIKWVYLIALFIFELGSLICAVSPSSTALIVGRAIAGVGSGGVGSGSFLLVAHSVPPRQRPTLVGLIGSMYGFASVAGPLLGGVFTDSGKLTWRFCFYINLPLGFVTGIVILLFVSSLTGKTKKTTGSSISIKEQLKQMDLPGTAFLFPGVICLMLALQWGGTKYEWRNGRIIALLVLAVLLLAVFVVVQIISGERATVPPRVFSNRNTWGSALFGSGVTAGFFIMLYYIPIWFQAVKDASAVKSGIMSLPMVISFVIFSVAGGFLTTATGYYLQFVYLTVICMSVGSGLLSTLKVDSGHAEWIGFQVIFGVGVGFGLQAAFTAVQTALSLEDMPIGTAIIMFCENLTASIMISVAQNVFSNQLKTNLKHYAPHSIDPDVILTAGATQIKHMVPKESYDDVLLAYNKSLTQTFYVAVAMSSIEIFGAVFIEWLSVKKKVDKSETKEEIPAT